MCFECLLAFPPFSSSANAGAKKALSRLSRPTSPATDDDGAYGPPLDHSLNQEDLPEYGIDPDGDIKVMPEETDSGTYVEHTGTDSEEASQTAEMEMNTNLTTTNADDNFVYEQDVEIAEESETSFDTELKVSATIPTVTPEKEEKIETDGRGSVEKTENKNIVAKLEVHLEYDENNGRLKVSVMKAVEVSNQQEGFKSYRVRLSLRRRKVQSSKTRVRPAADPEFKELFRFQNLPKSDLSISELVFKLNGIGSGNFAKEKLFGSATLNLTAMKASAKQSFLIPLSAANKT